MPNFLLICDPDTPRRTAVAGRALPQAPFMPRLRASQVLAGRYALVWAVAQGAPTEHHRGATAADRDVHLFGQPHDANGHLPGAAELATRYADLDRPAELNDFYAALVIDPLQGVRVEADVLGVLPIYYWHSGDVLLVATSPELFRCHPLFQPAPDLHAAAGLLLTSGLVGGRTLWQGVRRLAADHLLRWQPGSAPRECAPPPAPRDEPLTDLSEAVGQAADLHREFLVASLKHAQRPGLQLSGGLDSRLLAGFVTELGHRPECLTFGRAGDLDARCATQVARSLRLPQTLWESRPEDYARYADACVEWELLSGGLYSLAMGWNLAVRPPPVEMDRMVCGLTLDAVIGGPKFAAKTDATLAFEHLRIGRLGFRAPVLDRLNRSPELRRACDDVRAQLVERYRTADQTDSLREWRTNLAHRHRFAVGVCAWRFSLYAWPVLPALDRRLIRLAAQLPPEVAGQRQVQTRMLIARFPELARLEIDRNYVDTFPLLAPKLSPLGALRRRAVRWGRRVQTWCGREPRFYVRTMQINGPGWRVVRARAEPARAAASGWFDAGELARVVPPPQVRIRGLEDAIIHSTPLKNTLGLMLWLRPPT